MDKQQLPTEMDGEFQHCHSDWFVFRLVRRWGGDDPPDVADVDVCWSLFFSMVVSDFNGHLLDETVSAALAKC